MTPAVQKIPTGEGKQTRVRALALPLRYSGARSARRCSGRSDAQRRARQQSADPTRLSSLRAVSFIFRGQKAFSLMGLGGSRKRSWTASLS